MDDWSPEAYARFRGFRLRPALDLLARVPPLPEGAILDLGCGNGAVGGALAARYPGRPLVGVDASPAMLSEARGTGNYTRLEEADAAEYAPSAPPALIFSNALLHWLGGHDRLMPRLAAMLCPGGALAVQMPAQHDAPSHRLLREIALDRHPDRFAATAGNGAAVADPADYARRLAPLGEVDAWETVYLHRLMPGADAAHPVRRFTEATAMRPWLSPLGQTEREGFVAAYDAALAEAYPHDVDGSVLFPFRRVFFVLTLRKAGSGAGA